MSWTAARDGHTRSRPKPNFHFPRCHSVFCELISSESRALSTPTSRCNSRSVEMADFTSLSLFNEENVDASGPFVTAPRTGTSCVFREFGTVTLEPNNRYVDVVGMWLRRRNDQLFALIEVQLVEKLMDLTLCYTRQTSANSCLCTRPVPLTSGTSCASRTNQKHVGVVRIRLREWRDQLFQKLLDVTL